MEAFSRKTKESFYEDFKKILLGRDTTQDIDILATVQDDRVSVLVRECGDVPLKICEFEVLISENVCQTSPAISVCQLMLQVEISLLNWALQAASSAKSTMSEVRALSSQVVDLKAQTKSMQIQIERFTALQETQERMMLSKFTTLLNQKKKELQKYRERSESGAHATTSKRRALSPPVASDETDEVAEAEPESIAASPQDHDSEGGSTQDESSVVSKEPVDDEKL